MKHRAIDALPLKTMDQTPRRPLSRPPSAPVIAGR
jgi:hypothetical protein